VERSNVVDREKLKQVLWRTTLIDKDLMAGWHFNETGGETLYDISQNGKNLTSFGASLNADGLWNTRAVSFNGEGGIEPDTSEAIKVMDYTNSPLTYSAWIKTSENGIVIDRGGGMMGLQLAVNNGNGQFIYKYLVNNCEITGTTNIIDGKWHHLAAMIDESGNMSLYIDGKLEAQSDCTLMANNPTQGLNIGYGGVAVVKDNAAFEGLIEEVRIYSRALEKDEIRALQEWNPTFVKQRLLIGVNDYYFRLVDPNNGWTKEDQELGDLNFGRNPKELNNENLEQIMVRKPVTLL